MGLREDPSRKQSYLIDGEEHIPVLFRIQDRDENGTPENITLIPNYRPVEVVIGDEFFLGYILKKMIKEPT